MPEVKLVCCHSFFFFFELSRGALSRWESSSFYSLFTAAAATRTGNTDAGEVAEKLLFAVKKQIKGAVIPCKICGVFNSYL